MTARGYRYRQGRRKSLSPAQVEELRARAAGGERKTVLAKQFGISRETLYCYLRMPTCRA